MVPEKIMFILSPQKGLGIPGVWRGLKGQTLRKCMKLLKLQLPEFFFGGGGGGGGGGGFGKHPFHEGGMDNLWNYTHYKCMQEYCM